MKKKHNLILKEFKLLQHLCLYKIIESRHLVIKVAGDPPDHVKMLCLGRNTKKIFDKLKQYKLFRFV